MATPEKQILACQSFRVKGDPKGICHKQTDGFPLYIEEEILNRGLDMQAVRRHDSAITDSTQRTRHSH